MTKNKNFKYIILAIVAVLIIGIILFFVFNGNKSENSSTNNLFISQNYKDLNFKLPNNYNLIQDENDYVLYFGDNSVYVSFNSRTFFQNSVLDFLKDNDYPEKHIKRKNINNYDWYSISYNKFGDRNYYYTAEKDGILYELNIWAPETDDKSIIEKDVNSIVKTLKF